MQIYSFRYDDWSDCSVVGYDRVRRMHYCRYESTGEKHWHTLGSKKVQVVGHASPYSAGRGEEEEEGEEYGDDFDFEMGRGEGREEQGGEGRRGRGPSLKPAPVLTSASTSGSGRFGDATDGEEEYGEEVWEGVIADTPPAVKNQGRRGKEQNGQGGGKSNGGHIHMTKIVSPAASDSSKASSQGPRLVGGRQ